MGFILWTTACFLSLFGVKDTLWPVKGDTSYMLYIKWTKQLGQRITIYTLFKSPAKSRMLLENVILL